MTIEVRNLTKRFDRFTALDGIDLKIEPGELVALLGPSGSGKTTLLRIIAGLDFATAGTLLFDGEDASSTHVARRQVGFVFQHYALFRHMTVFDNVAFGLRVKPRDSRPSKAAIREKVNSLLSLVQIGHLANRYPSQLSGGQRQRAALARALAVEPRMLLLDEPFGALDAKVRKELRSWLRRLHDQMGLTSIFVTHDQEEALELADRVVVMSQGRIEQVGSPDEVYDRPATRFVSEFLGEANRLTCPVVDGHIDVLGLELGVPPDGPPEVIAFVRPHDLILTVEPEPGSRAATLRAQGTAGAMTRLHLELDGGHGLDALLERHAWQRLRVGLGGRLYVRAQDAKIFPADPSQQPARVDNGSAPTIVRAPTPRG
jgi:sulfate transport system ATP-binding protein